MISPFNISCQAQTSYCMYFYFRNRGGKFNQSFQSVDSEQDFKQVIDDLRSSYNSSLLFGQRTHSLIVHFDNVWDR